MDPQAALELLFASVLENDEDMAVVAFDGLCEWIHKGGFRPDVARAIKHAWDNHE